MLKTMISVAAMAFAIPATQAQLTDTLDQTIGSTLDNTPGRASGAGAATGSVDTTTPTIDPQLRNRTAAESAEERADDPQATTRSPVRDTRSRVTPSVTDPTDGPVSRRVTDPLDRASSATVGTTDRTTSRVTDVRESAAQPRGARLNSDIDGSVSVPDGRSPSLDSSVSVDGGIE